MSRWHSLSEGARAHISLAVGSLGILLILLFAVAPALPCDLPGGDSCAPADDAADIVPGDALAYLHADLEPGSDQYVAAQALGDDLPVIGGQVADRVLALIPGPGGDPPDFDADIAPWFGGELAIAVLPGSPIPQRVDLVEVGDPAGAASYVQDLAVGTPETSEYEGVEVSVDQRDVATAQVGGFLAIGRQEGVRDVIATATGADAATSLSDDPLATPVRDLLPERSLVDGWISADGIQTLIGDDRGTIGTASPLLAPGASNGAALALGAGEGELTLTIRSALDPAREQDSPSFFAAFPSFEPQLAQKLPSDTLGYLGIGAPASTVTALLDQATSDAPGVADAFRSAVAGLERRADIDLQGDLLDALGDEAALALEPPADDQLGGLPYALFVASGVDEDAAREALAALQRPLAGSFSQQEVDGVETNSLRLSPTLELTYAVFDGLVAIATDPAGVADLRGGDASLQDLTLYTDATAGFADRVALLAYLDLAGLVRTGEQAGLAEDPLYATFAGDFRRLESLGLAVSLSDDVLATDARLTVGELTSSATDD